MTLKLFRPLTALVFASTTGCILVALRCAWLGQGKHLYLVWNLFLAWLPLLFALGVLVWERTRSSRQWVLWTLASAWLLFFPNAPYILTDIVHLGAKTRPYFWSDLVLILVFALTGVVLGFVSLYVMQRVVARRFGWVASWIFVGAATFLNGFGIYAGRFLRWNSWDVIASPITLLVEGLEWVGNMPGTPRHFLLPVLFSIFTFLAYVMLHSLTHLPAGLPLASNQKEGNETQLS